MKRLIARVLSIVLAVPMLAILVLTILFHDPEPPSVQDLQKQYASRKSDLNTLVHMSMEDSKYIYIGTNSSSRDLNLNIDASHPDMRFNDLPRNRWDEYRNIFARNQIDAGLHNDGAGDVFITVRSIGLLNRGHVRGYLYCSKPHNPKFQGLGYAPCEQDQAEGTHPYDPKTRDEGYSFLRINDSWYAYDEGPS